MVINDWWAGDPAERYWMEITDRDDVGDDLNAPTLNGAGKPEWSYTLITETQPGDIVLHWHKKSAGRPALVGWSLVIGPLAVLPEYEWQARGTRGRARGVPTKGQGWLMPCGGLNPLRQPITDVRIDELAPQLRDVHDQLARRVRGPIYFPFTFYRARRTSAAQAYLTKFPAALVRAMPELAGIAVDVSSVVARKGTIRRSAGSGYMQDGKLKKAIEQYSVDWAERYYYSQGATEVVRLGKPYDLIVRGLGPELHVEVKGSTAQAVSIELTVNEVHHAHNHIPTDLVVVDGITYRKVGEDYVLSGGQIRTWRTWAPKPEHLEPTRYRYVLPDG